MKFESFVVASVLSGGTSACLEHLIAQHLPDGSVIRSRAPAPRIKTAITNVHVFDGEHFGPRQAIIIDGEQVSTNVSGIESTIDAAGGYLIPGLIDSHVHISDTKGLEALTSFGVTTAMVMACRNYTACAPFEG